MLMTDIIAKKRDGMELSSEEIEFFVSGAADGSIPDYQLSALLMAIYLKGMTEEETADLALSMAKSGDMLDLRDLGDKTVDKHSTGGVGDKTTLICSPIAAAMGCTVAKMSGRGLGHTGGTVDKLESIKGYNTSPDKETFLSSAKKYGLCLAGHSGNFTPADKKLYSLRDVTSTVESIPLIASSIMSKKLASGAKNIVLDVKFGSGAFMKTPEDAEKLAKEMVRIGSNTGKNTVALITDMEIPLGRNIGNALEIAEAVEILKGNGDKRLTELCLTLAAAMHSLSFNEDFEASLRLAEEKLLDGSAFKILCDSVAALGGDSSMLTGETEFPKAQSQISIYAKKSGYISSVNSMTVGKAAQYCGAGRELITDKIDPAAGIVLHKTYGDYVNRNEVIATLYGNAEKIRDAEKILKEAFALSENIPPQRKLVYKIIKEEKKALTKNPKYIHEPTPLQCGQAVLAMLSDRQVDEIVSLTGTERETDLKQMFSALEHYNISYKKERRAVSKKEELPRIALLSLETPKCWHWSLFFDGKFLDPEYGVLDDFPPSNRRYYWEITG